uniref:Uncharacterized protein n=1 Tax=viral metagenome TaxID=1070528 RepID=A0A6C0LQN2_9ZZZZ
MSQCLIDDHEPTINLQKIATRGGNDPISLQGYIPLLHKMDKVDRYGMSLPKFAYTQNGWRTDGYDVKKFSNDPREIAIRGGNDPVNISSYYDTTQRPLLPIKKPITKNMIEKFSPGYNQRNDCTTFGLVSEDKRFNIYMNQPDNRLISTRNW